MARSGALGPRFLGVPLVSSFCFRVQFLSAKEHLCISELLISLCFGCDAFTYFSPWFQPPIALGVGGKICAWG